jgi:hypothetical protein
VSILDTKTTRTPRRRELGVGENAMQLQRRTVALLAAAAAISKSAQPSRAALAPYSLELPPGFVRLGNLGSRSSASGYLLVAGDFRDTIGAGSATTSACDACISAHYLYALTQTNCDPAVSVQLIDRRALPPLPTDAPGLAAALAQSRDKDTTNFEPSTVLVDTLCGPDCARPRLNSAELAGLPEPRTQQLDTGSCLRFEMLTSLVGGGGAASADPSLMRHTLVQVTETSPWVLCDSPKAQHHAPLPCQAQVLPDALLVLWAARPAEEEGHV